LQLLNQRLKVSSQLGCWLLDIDFKLDLDEASKEGRELQRFVASLLIPTYHLRDYMTSDRNFSKPIEVHAAYFQVLLETMQVRLRTLYLKSR
jgi:hypothetical protein